MEEVVEEKAKNKYLIKLRHFYDSHLIAFYLISFIIIFLSIFILQKAYYSLSVNKYFIQKKISSSETDEYKKTIEKQKQNNKSVVKTKQAENRKADKEYKVNFIFVKPKDLNESSLASLVDNLKNNNEKFEDCKYSNCKETLSLNYLNEYYKSQQQKYEKKDFSLNLIFSRIYEVENLNKVGDFAYVWGKDPFAVANLTDTFEEIIKENKLNPNDIYVFLYFDDSYEIGQDSRDGSFYEAKKFRSFAIEEKNRAYINVYDLSPQMSSKITEIAAHEILHLFGASDKYNENINDSEVCGNKGWGEPEKRPLFPQTKGDIMCLYVENQPNKFKRGDFIKGELVINEYTAEEIGWKN